MNVLKNNPELVKESQIARMNRFWGDDSWKDACYRKDGNLFGYEEKIASNEAVVQAFQQRLKKVAGFKYVPDPLPMRQSTNAPLYYLFFASPNDTGSKIVNDIFDKYRKWE